MSNEALERLLDVARHSEPEPYTEAETLALVSTALAAAEDEPMELPRRSYVRIGLAIAAAAVVIIAATAFWPTEAAPISRMVLPSGDALVAAAGTRFEVRSADAARRRIHLDDGAMLFDVDPLDASESFEVNAPGVTVRVRGTVFSVETRDGRTVVRVYEGEVEVEYRGGSRRVGRTEVWASSTEAEDPHAELERLGHLAALERDRLARLTVDPMARPRENNSSDEAAETLMAEEPNTNPTEDTDRGDELSIPNPAVEETPAPPRRRAVERDHTSPAAPDPEPTLADATRLLAAGEYEAALAITEARRGRPSPDWGLVRADALRGLQRFAEAADNYDVVARAVVGSHRAQAGFKSAQLRFQHLNDAEGALRSLDRSEAWHGGSPLEERALGLRVRALHRLGQHGLAQLSARTYLDRFPNAALADWMRRLAEAPTP